MQNECALPRGTGKYEAEQQQYGDSAYSDPELLRDYIRVQPDAFQLPSNAGYVVRTELAQARGKDLCQIHATVGSRSTSLAKRMRIQPQALRDLLGRF